MRRVVFNQKGGVGKSSITVNLAALSAAQGYKTLLIDLDVQGNSSHYLGVDINIDNKISIADLLNQTVGWFSMSTPIKLFLNRHLMKASISSLPAPNWKKSNLNSNGAIRFTN
ncbi:hypothetical ParA family protein [Photobacterium aphoticum]|uniref:Hypothetical ParA family protein n=1 Tax=Photobacterium aphoticum TaxID=754436 RepID=A0A090RL98_9GAMM|nr:hypothetical ParA family protein [Photobacterium aphoticum]